MITFTGTVVACESRFTTKVKVAKLVDFNANWVLTVDVETGEPPFPAGERVSFLFHSPAQLFRSGDDDFTGWRCEFTVEREITGERTSWSNLTARRMK